MSDTELHFKNGRKRPISPHLSIYKPQITSVMSITHRITGVFLLLGLFVDTSWLVALSCSEESFNYVNGFMTSFIGKVIMLGFIFSIFYHLCNGIRHLFWDFGKGLDIEIATKSGIFVIAISVVLATATFISFISHG